MKRDSVVIHGERLVLKEFESIIDSCRTRTWKEQRWISRPALVFETGTISKFIGQDYDPQKATLNKKAWEHDHCEICGWMLNEEMGRNIGYIDADENWLCSECYTQFIIKSDNL